VADLEYAIRTHELFKRWFARALMVHIVLSVTLYALLILHIWSGFYFGLRWWT
jgi:predicted MarR family transcription regulator